MEDRKKPMSGELYRHFKGNLYQILTVAAHTETGEELVVYQALYGDYGFYARPLPMFMSKVDRVKYPDVTAVYRFERFDPKKEEKTQVKGPLHQEDTQSVISVPIDQAADKNQWVEGVASDLYTKEGISAILMEFLDAATFREKLEIVQSNRKAINDKIINDMAMSIDCTVSEGDMEERIASLIYCLQTRIRFEARRLR